MYAVEIENLSFGYSIEKTILKNLNLKINESDSVALVGENGSGKSTLMMLVAGMLKASEGAVKVFGETSSAEKFNPNVGAVFQNPDDQLFHLSVYDEVAFVLKNMKMPKEEIKTRTSLAMEKTNITHLKDRAPHSLSGGEKRMVSLAAVISAKPKLMLYDEPTASVDMCYRRKVLELVQSNACANIIATHDLEFALETCSRAVVLKNGNILEDGAPEKIFRNKKVAELAGFEVPHSLR